MDIYKFINSKDIEKHCRDIGFNFNPLESAFLIWQSRKHTIQEKHAAYSHILNQSAEFEFLLREWDYKKTTMRDFLQNYMRIEDGLLSSIEENKPAAVTYIKSLDDIDSQYPYQEKLYLSKEVCFSAIKEFEPKCNWNKCKLIYRSLISDINAKANSISIHFDEEFNTVFVTETAQLSANDSKIFHTFDEMQIKVPLPFEDYDNLIEKYRYGATSFEYVVDEFQFSDKGMGLSHWVYPFDEEIYVRNYLNLEYAPKLPQKEYDPDDEDVPF